LENGWTPKTDIQLSEITFADLEKPIKESIRIKNKEGFSAVFGIPRFGDVTILRKEIKEKYFATDKKFDAIKNLLDKEPDRVSLEDVIEMDQYYIDKAMFITKLTKCFYIKELDGKDLSEKNFEEKMEISNDPRLDAPMFKKYEKELKSLSYGIIPEVKVMNPFTKTPCVRRFVFRPFNILQIILLSEFDEYDVSYE